MSNPMRKFLDCLSSKGISHTNSGGGIRFACPAHQGQKDSAIASIGDGGKLILYCHSHNCTAEDIARGAGMEPRDMFPDSERHQKHERLRKVDIDGKQVPVHPTREAAAFAAAFGIQAMAEKDGWPFTQRKPDVEFDYHDAEGRISFVVCRWNTPGRSDDKNKEIRQIRPFDGGWITKGLESNRPLFRLPVVALPEATTIFVVEGEKASNALDSIGLACTTSAGGSKAESKTDWSTLAGKTVIVLPDNDSAGDTYAAKVTAAIRQQAAGATVRICLLSDDWSEIPEKGDAYDWIQQFSNEPHESLRARLEGLPDKTSEYNTTSEKESSQEKTKPPRTFAGIDASELASYATQEADWLVDGIFTSDEPLLEAARSKGCKTLQFIDLAVALATQTKWMDHFEVPKRRKVLFISGETNYRRTAKHIEAALKARDLKWDNLKGFLRIETMDFPSLPSESDQAAIHETVKNHGIELVICDPMYRGLSGVDSSRLNEVGSAIKSFQAACQPACMALSHHVVKSAAREYGEPPTLEDMTGAGLAETAGQWWLIGRNSKYEWNGIHDLCVQFGGREGQAGGKRILFNEREWTFQVEPWNEFIDEISEERQRQRDDAKREAEEIKSNQTRVRILKACRDCKTPRSRSRMRDDAGLSGTSFGSVFAELVREQSIVLRPYRDGANRIQPEGYLLAEFAADYDKRWNTS